MAQETSGLDRSSALSHVMLCSVSYCLRGDPGGQNGAVRLGPGLFDNLGRAPGLCFVLVLTNAGSLLRSMGDSWNTSSSALP